MEGLLPPNIALHASDTVSDGVDRKARLHVGCSSEGDEVVVWRELEGEERRTMEHVLSTSSSAEAADRFNYELAELGAAGFDISSQLEVNSDLLDKLRPGRRVEEKTSSSNEGSPSPSSSILY